MISVCRNVSDDDAGVQQLGSSSAAMNVDCSPQWIVHPRILDANAMLDGFDATQQYCLQRCTANSRCVAANYFIQVGCALSTQNVQRENVPGFTLFEIVKGCDPPSGTVF